MRRDIQVTTASLGESLTFAQQQPWRVLGLMSSTRSEFARDVPTFKEAGYDIRGGSLRGIGAPRGLAEDVVRRLSSAIGAVLRHLAVRLAEGKGAGPALTVADLDSILGPPLHENETAMRTSVPGVATGLAWTPAGGDILFIEATRVPGSGRLLLTGQLGEVMKESAQAALSAAKAQLEPLGLPGDLLEKSDLHIHVPAGATPKDGPSAGVAIYVALISLFSGRPVRPEVAMTGEISLRGLVLPVGGVKEKVLAARRAARSVFSCVLIWPHRALT
jgi:ATP-dependent Lon protease